MNSMASEKLILFFIYSNFKAFAEYSTRTLAVMPSFSSFADLKMMSIEPIFWILNHAISTFLVFSSPKYRNF
jgi:hypothetical protein